MGQKGHPLPSAQVRRIKRLHAAGYCQRDIAARLGCAEITVSRWLARLGLAAHGNATDRSRSKLRRVYREHIAASEVACLCEFRWIRQRIERIGELRREEGWVESRRSKKRPSLEKL